MRDHIAIVEGKGVNETHWCTSVKEADEWLAQWLRDNKETRPYVRTTVAKCLITIEG